MVIALVIFFTNAEPTQILRSLVICHLSIRSGGVLMYGLVDIKALWQHNGCFC
jgi:hypothetical protein